MKKELTILAILSGIATGGILVFSKMNKKVKYLQQLNHKNDAILKLYSQWMKRKPKDMSMVEYFKEKGYQKIAIYGMHYLGETLYGELENTDIEVRYVIDRNADNISCGATIYKPDGRITDAEQVDVVVVTAFSFYDEIEEELSQYLDCPIISLEDILHEM